MKQITFNYFRRLALMLLAVVGFTTTALAQDWEEIVHKPLTSTSEEGLVNGTDRDLSNFISPSQIGPSLNLSAGTSNSDNYIAIKSNSIEEGTYKFSYKIFPLGNSGNIHFFYCKEGDEANKNEVLVSSLSSLSTTSATVIETPEFKISEAGTYLFGWHCDTFGADIYFCDFYLYKKAESSTTTFTVNFDNNENVTIEVTDANGNTINSGDPVEADTEITITPTAAPGYKVKTVYANRTKLNPKTEIVDGQNITRYKTTVTEDTEITVETSIIQYTVSAEAVTNGSIALYNTTDLDTPLDNNTKLTAGNQVKVVATPNPDYKLARVYYKYSGYNYESEAIEITDNGEGYIFTVGPDPESANTAIYVYAEFTEAAEPVEPYAQNFGQGVGDTGWGYRSWTNTVFTTSTDGTKTVNVNYKTNVSSYEIYSDALVSEENKATVYLGEQFDLTINGGMNWLYTLVYIDWNGDGVFDEAVDGTENLGFNPVTERDFGAGSTTNENVRTYKVTVPDDAKVGDTRVRIILGWKQTNLEIIPPAEADKERREMTSTTIDDKKNAMARDFSLCIMDNQLAERTITLAVNDPSMGKAVITGTEDTSITTSDINVSVTAIPEEGYMFVNWTDAEGEILSTDNPYLYGGLESATITANFDVKTYPVMTRKYTTINQQNRYLKEVVATVGGEAQTLFTATSTSELPLTEYTTAEEVTEKGALIDKTDTPIVLEQGTTSFDMTFKAWTEAFSVNGESCTQQIVWTSQAIYVDWNNDKDFDDANECLGAVGTPATGNNFGDTNGNLENGWTRTLNVPSDVAAGTYRMRVVYNENSVTDWDKTFFTAGRGNINAGVSYDFEIRIEEHAETWSEVHFNSLSGSKANEINLNNDPYYINPEKTSTDGWNTTNSSGASETADKYGPYIKTVSEGYYLAYRYDVEKSATYRFSFLHKKAGTVETTAKLCYTTSLSEAFIDASDVVALEKKDGKDPGVLFRSNNIELEKGSYYFIYYIVSGGESKVRIADFKLEMLDGSAVEPTPEYTVTLNKPENGNLSVTYNNGEEDITVSTDDATEPQTFNVAKDTKLKVTVTPAEGFILESLSPDMTEVADSENVYEYTVTEAVTIEATFIKVAAFEYVPVPIRSGFNTDVIAEATPSADHTSGTLDSEGWVLFTSDIQEEGALPLDLTTVDNIPYKMADVTSNNAAVLKGENTESTLVFKNPAKAEEVRLLSISAEGASTMEVTVNYDDDTNKTQSFTIADWWNSDGGQGEAYYGLDRIITENEGRYSKDQIDGRKQFRLFEQVVTTDPEKTIVSVKVVNKSTGTKTPSVLGVTVLGELLEVEPIMHSITVNKPVNGSLFIEYTVNDETQKIDTYAFENDSEVFSIPENTVMNIYPTAEYDYELDQILPEGMEEKTDLRGRKYYVLTVTEDATIEATFKAILYGNVSITKPEEAQGSIEIEFKNPMSGEWQVADDFYLEAVVFGTELRAKVEAKTGYTLKSVMKNGTAIDKNADGYYYFTVDAEDITISAEFEQEQGTYYTITIDVTKPEQGSVKVEMSENGEIKNVANGDKVKENTELTITPEANEGYIFTTLLIDNRPVQLTDGSYKMTVTKDTKIAPKFKEVVSSFELNWVEPENGTLKLYKTSDLENPLTQKSSIEVGTEIKVVVEENEGYDLSKVYYKYFPTEKTVDIAKGENGYVFTVEADNENPNNSIIYIYADFEPETYTLTTEVNPAEGGSVSVTVNGATVEGTVKYGDVITVAVTVNEGYLLESIVVEGAEEVEGQKDQYTVTGDVTITVTFKKDTSSINSIENGTVYYNAEEEVLYTDAAKSVRVYDLSGRLVLNAENQDNVSLAELAEGIYTAVVDGTIIKLNK